MQNNCNLIGRNSAHIPDIFICYSGNINGMWNAQKLNGKYKTFQSTLTYKTYMYRYKLDQHLTLIRVGFVGVCFEVGVKLPPV